MSTPLYGRVNLCHSRFSDACRAERDPWCQGTPTLGAKHRCIHQTIPTSQRDACQSTSAPIGSGSP